MNDYLPLYHQSGVPKKLEIDTSRDSLLSNFFKGYEAVRCSKFIYFRRRWNKLSRLQKSSLLLAVILLSVICIVSTFVRVPSSNDPSPGGQEVFPHIEEKSSIVGKEPKRINQEKEVELQTDQEIKPYLEDLKPPVHQVATDESDSLPTIRRSAGEPIKFSGPRSIRQKAVVEAFQHAWRGYKKYAWGHDHLAPISRTYLNWFGAGLTLVDSLDTLYIMNLHDEFVEATRWVRDKLSFDIDKDVNFFETTIRVLGGLLSAYHLSKEDIFLEKAVDLGDRLMASFSSPSNIPFSDVNLKTRIAHGPKWNPDSSTSEVTTVQLEFRDLSRCTGDKKYENAVDQVNNQVHQLEKLDGLVPIYINTNTGKFRYSSAFTLGARADSYYEYLLKQWIQTGKTRSDLVSDYNASIAGIEKHLLKTTYPGKIPFIGELTSMHGKFRNKMDHLACYLPATLALGTHNGLPEEHLVLAQKILNTCYLTYTNNPTSLAAEITYFNIDTDGVADMIVKPNDAHNLLRPETVESLWYLYHFTGNTTYQEWGWKIFQAFEKYTKVDDGYTSIGNVLNAENVQKKDMMESFFLGETLKYFYLLFSNDQSELSLDEWVFNTEAHPLPIYKF